MKLPSLRNIESVIRMMPAIKELVPVNKDNKPESELAKLVKKVKQQEDTIYAKKNEIEILKKKNSELEEALKDYRSAIGGP